jgi:AhpD family alkylhydroperoxidase
MTSLLSNVRIDLLEYFKEVFQMEDPKQVMADFDWGFEALSKADKKRMDAFWNFLETSYEPDYVDEKTKELILVGAALCARCVYCIAYHCRGAVQAGATRGEIVQTGWIVTVMCGGPAQSYMMTFLMKCLDEFAPEDKE